MITVSFFGHREIYDIQNIEKKLERIIIDLIIENDYVEFLIGRDGEFDRLVSSVIRKCKKNIRDDNNAHVLILPYMTAEFKNNMNSFNEFYDEIEICEESANAHFKAAHQIRNRYMVKRSNLVVFYVEHFSGGAYKTLKFAEKENANFINISFQFDTC